MKDCQLPGAVGRHAQEVEDALLDAPRLVSDDELDVNGLTSAAMCDQLADGRAGALLLLVGP
jgi:hypothetical protein